MVTIVPFKDAHLPAAAHLLAASHRTHRRHTPLLPVAFETALEALALLDTTWRWPGAAGFVALDHDAVVGFLIGLPGHADDDAAHQGYVPASGYAVRPALATTVTAPLFDALARHWHGLGRHEHHVQLTLADATVATAWAALGFEPFLVLAAAALPLPSPTTPPADVRVRQATDDDLETVVQLMRALRQHHAAPPIGLPPPTAIDDRDHVDQRRMLADPRTGCWLAFLDDRAVGLLTLRPPGTAIAPLHLPPATIHVVDAVTLAAARGRGVGTVLCAEALGWAHVIGYRHAALHVHAANRTAQRFWEARRFVPIAQQRIRRRTDQ